jgi:hypothetical protein
MHRACLDYDKAVHVTKLAPARLFEFSFSGKERKGTEHLQYQDVIKPFQ